ncbi:MAG: hypothetical protein U0Q11_26400 [Vicinamibacterales bacterium]
MLTATGVNEADIDNHGSWHLYEHASTATVATCALSIWLRRRAMAAAGLVGMRFNTIRSATTSRWAPTAGYSLRSRNLGC